jgi:hypothetical protein
MKALKEAKTDFFPPNLCNIRAEAYIGIKKRRIDLYPRFS